MIQFSAFPLFILETCRQDKQTDDNQISPKAWDLITPCLRPWNEAP
jgi:hypothetical protein